MATHVRPTVQDIKDRYPELAGVADGRIAFAIEEAQSSLDTSWLASTYAPAYRALVAHKLVMEGALRPTSVPGTAIAPGPITGYSLGDASVSFGSSGNAGADKGTAEQNYQSTPYGKEFARLRRANFSGPIVATGTPI